MNKIVFMTASLLLVFPFMVGAHSGDTTSTESPGFMMMQQIEDQALGDELHEEMEALMIRMMSGEMSSLEAERMVELMETHPGPHGMMMNRFAGFGCDGDGCSLTNNRFGFGMMGPGMMGFFGGATFFWWITQLLIWAILILVIVALAKWIKKY